MRGTFVGTTDKGAAVVPFAILKGFVEGLVLLVALAVMAAILFLLAPEARAEQPLSVRFSCVPEPAAKATLQAQGYTPISHWTDVDGDPWFLVARPDGSAAFGVMIVNAETGAREFCAMPGRVPMGARS